jgi:hypothetical protein
MLTGASVKHVNLTRMDQFYRSYPYCILAPSRQFRGVGKQIPVDELITIRLGTNKPDRDQQEDK